MFLHKKVPVHAKKANRRSKDVVPLILNPEGPTVPTEQEAGWA